MTSTRSSTYSWTGIEAKLGSSWSSWEKLQWNGRIEAVSRLNIRDNCEEKIDRRSRYYPWTHWQDTGIAEWNQLYERFERFSRCWISTQWTFPRCQSTCVIPTSSNTWRDVETLFRNAEPQRRAAKHLGHTWYIGNRFCKSSRVFFSTLSARVQSLVFFNVSEHTSPHVMSESHSPNTTLDPRCQSGPSARNSFDPSEGRFSKNYGADQQRLQISDLHFDKFTTPATFACRQIKFKTEVCTCSQFPTEAMLWIKEVEMVDPVGDLKSSFSVRGIRMPDFEVLDAKIASALNRIIHNTQFKRKVEQKSPKKGPFPSRKTDRLPDLRVLPGHWSQWYRRELCRPIYYFSSKWWHSGIPFEMGRNFIINDENPISWYLGRIVQIKNTRVWETQDRIGIVQYGDSSEESRTWLSQIVNNGKKKYRAESTN